MKWSGPVLIYSHPEAASTDLEPVDSPDPGSDLTLMRLGALTRLNQDPDVVFDQLHDPELLLTFLPGSSLTRIVDARNFMARAVIGVGPIRLGYDAEACITASDPSTRTASMTVQARPRAVGLPFRVRMAMAINPIRIGCRLEMRLAIAVSGRRGRLPKAWLDRIGCDVLESAVHELKGHLDRPIALPVAPAS